MYSVACGVSCGRSTPSASDAFHHASSYSAGDLGLGATLRSSTLDDLVVDVGHVGDVVDVEAAEDEVAAEHIEDERIPDRGRCGARHRR